jgi:hypothetical protein
MAESTDRIDALLARLDDLRALHGHANDSSHRDVLDRALEELELLRVVLPESRTTLLPGMPGERQS